jgi:TatD DNase family protein
MAYSLQFDIMLIDTHAHLTDARFADDLEAVVRRAGDAGVAAIVDVGDGAEGSAACIEHARRFRGVFAAVGIHPNSASAGCGLDRIAVLARDEAVVALGETGFDYYRRHASREAQERLFRGTLDLALETGLPVVVHCREAYGALLGVLREPRYAGVRGALHCFSGGRGDAEDLVGLGYFISAGGALTYPGNAALRETIRAVPLDRLLLETDCPYLPPEGARGRRNEPSGVVRVAEELARLRGLSPGEIARITSDNALRLFERMGAAGERTNG